MDSKFTTPVLAVLIASIAGMAAGQTGDLKPEPGFIKADSPLYPVDKVFDSITQSQAETAFERASEYAVAESQSERQKALESLNNSIARVAASNTTQGLEKAQAVLQQVKKRTPDQANQGLETAIENLGKAQRGELKPEDVPAGPNGGLPDGVSQRRRR